MSTRTTPRRARASCCVAVLATAVSALLGPTPATAGSGRAVVVVDPGCTFDEDFAQAWTAPDGTEHVLYSVEGNESFGCGGPRSGRMWHAVRRPGGTWVQVRTPYQGRLMAVSGDATGLYLMFADRRGTWLARRSPAGTFSLVRRLSTLGRGTRTLPSGALVVRGGRWWAVWNENRSSTTFGTTDLWQARTLGQPAGQPQLRSRVTDSPDRHDDQPHLALRADGSAFLLWTDVDDQSGAVTLRAATSPDSPGALWSSTTWEDRSPSLSSDVDTGPDGVVAVVWGSAGALYYADDRTGVFRRERLPAGLHGPAVAVTPSAVFVAATTESFRTRLLTRPAAGGTWTSIPVTTHTVSRTLDVDARGGSATVYVSDEHRLLSRSTG